MRIIVATHSSLTPTWPGDSSYPESQTIVTRYGCYDVNTANQGQTERS